MMTFPFDDYVPDAAECELIFEAACAQDRLDEASEDYRLELAEFYGIAEAEQRLQAE